MKNVDIDISNSVFSAVGYMYIKKNRVRVSRSPLSYLPIPRFAQNTTEIRPKDDPLLLLFFSPPPFLSFHLRFFKGSFSSRPPALTVFARLTGAAVDNKRYASHRLAKY